MSSKTNSISTQKWAQLQEIFEQALELAAEERKHFIEKKCGDDDVLKRQALSLIAAADSDQELVSGLIRTAADQVLQKNQRTRAFIGSFKVLDVIGTGGMGVVYLAQRDDDEFHQRVAIKILHDDLAGEDAQLRFKTERQILADLNHPNIARLLDGGHTEDGQPYLVMEHVDGEPIVEYCDRHRLDVDARIDLFKQICSAVAAAHRSLVVHRDIKPSNILVGSDGVPKLLDFGIAKVLSNRLRDVDLAKTQLGDRLLTPDCASPEQVQGLPVTTASDIYSLGVLLYQLLCGRRPFRLLDKTPAEMERIILDDEPSLASESIGNLTSQDSVAKGFTARLRSTTVDKLKRRLRGELDTIIMMALKKEPQRRYASASQFAADLTRYQSGLPVYAVRETSLYHVSKAIKRNKLATGALAALITALGVFSVFTSIQSRHIAQERDISQNSLEFMMSVFSQSNPDVAQSSDLTARDLLDRGAALVDTELANQPAVRASLQRVIGVAYQHIESSEKGMLYLRPALETRLALYGDGHPYVADLYQDIGTIMLANGQTDEAMANFQKAMAIWENRESVVFFKLQPEKHLRAKLSTLGLLLNVSAVKLDFAQAEKYYEQGKLIAASNRTHPIYAAEEIIFLNFYARALHRQSRFKDSVPVLLRATELAKKWKGMDHTLTAGIQEKLGAAYLSIGETDLANETFVSALAVLRNVYKPDAPRRLGSEFIYARFLARTGEEARAAIELQRILDVRRKRGQGMQEDGYYLVLLELTRLYLNLNDIEQAEPLLAEAAMAASALRARDSLLLIEFHRHQGMFHTLSDQPEVGLESFDQAIAIATENGLESGWQVAACRSEKSVALMALQRWPEAATALEQSMMVLDKVISKDHSLYQQTLERAAQLAQHYPEFSASR